MNLYLARLLYPVKVLGPGSRIGLWFCGCPRRCPGCSNPELWEFQERYLTTPQRVAAMIKDIARRHKVDGFTVTGGDPFYQPESLAALLAEIVTISADILVYTGYQKEEIPPGQLKNIAVLIDGSYIESRNTNALLRGSDNQRILILNEKYRPRYETYLATAQNQVQNFMVGGACVSVGIHRSGFRF